MGSKEAGSSGFISQEASIDGFGHFLKAAGRYPLLTAHQEVLLFQEREREMQYQQQLGRKLEPHERRGFVHNLKQLDSDFAATITPDSKEESQFRNVFSDSGTIDNVISNCNIRLAIWGARKIPSKHLTLEDKVQSGMEGIIKFAIPHFDYTKGYKFSTYAKWWIRKSIGNAVQDEDKTIRVPAQSQEDLRKVQEVADAHVEISGSYPSQETLADLLVQQRTKLNLVPQNAAELPFLPTTKEPHSLNAPLQPDDDRTLEATIADTKSDASFASILDNVLDRKVLFDALGDLSERERIIVMNRFFSDAPRALDELGEQFGVSDSQITKIQRKALEKLRNNERVRSLYYGDEIPLFVK